MLGFIERFFNLPLVIINYLAGRVIVSTPEDADALVNASVKFGVTFAKMHLTQRSIEILDHIEHVETIQYAEAVDVWLSEVEEIVSEELKKSAPVSTLAGK